MSTETLIFSSEKQQGELKYTGNVSMAECYEINRFIWTVLCLFFFKG